MNHNQLKNRLHRFLSTGRVHVDKSISDRWIEDRHQVSHAKDPSKTKLSLDVLASIPSCRQAAFDIVVNKKNWASNDVERLDPDGLGTVCTGPKRLDADFGAGTILRVSMVDPLGVFPLSEFPSRRGFQIALHVEEATKQFFGTESDMGEYVAGSPFGCDPISFYTEKMRSLAEADWNPPFPLYAAAPVTFRVV
jgi:hypothetical protein